MSAGWGPLIKSQLHAQHAGNEMADHLAKLGADQVIGPARFKYYEATASFSYSLLAKSNQCSCGKQDGMLNLNISIFSLNSSSKTFRKTKTNLTLF
jgi:hypothetical protein